MHKKIKILFSTLGSFILLLAVFVISHVVWAAAGTWSNTGSLNVARWAFTMTLLPDGKVLAVGGCTGAYCSMRATIFDVYNPTLGTWSPGELFVDGRYIGPAAHTATLMQDGKVLVVVGDYAGTNILYNPITVEWHTTGSSSIHRSCSGMSMPCHTATLLQDGRVLVTGGYSSTLTLNNAEIYNPVEGTWDSVSNMQSARWGHTATLLPNGTVLVAGGCCGGAGGYLPFDSAEIYDPFTNTWIVTGKLHYARSSHTATLLKNGKVLITGGNPAYVEAELYDSATGTWTDTGFMTDSRYRHTATLLPDGKVFVVGGSAPNGVALNSAEIYDPAVGTWSYASERMKSARAAHAAVLLQDAKVLVGGGYGNGYLTSAEIYDTGIQIWHQIYLPLIVH
jgi:hypothetical protein